MLDLAYAILGVTILSFVLFQLNQRMASPVLAIVNRWLRWAVFSTGVPLVVSHYQWIDRPYWVLAITSCAIWFLAETLYNWLAIHALSVSALPLFPKFCVNASGEEWPTHPRLLKIRDWFRAENFRQVQALKAEVVPGVFLRVSIYQDAEAHTRIQATFIPQPNGTIIVCFSLSSETVSGYRYITDNLYLPFGGFYPENWLVERNPWRRAPRSLLARHRERLKRASEMVVPWAGDPLGDLNAQQRELEKVNTELGFLFPHAEREDFGKMTFEGRYRVWKEIWLLNYFGRSARYE